MTRRWKLIAFFLPLAGLTMIVPPFVRVFAIEDHVFGVPVVILYMFALWAALIFVAFITQSRLSEPDDPNAPKDQISLSQDDD